MAKYNKAESAGLGAYDLASFGFAPKVGGALGALFARQLYPELFENEQFGETYKGGRDYLRNINKEAFEENPLSYLVGGLGGGILSPSKGAAASSLLSRIRQGATQGGLYGAGTSDTGEVGSIEPSNIFDITKGAGYGAIGGATIPYLLKGAGYLGNKLTPNAIKEGAANFGNKLSDLFPINAPQQKTAMEAFNAPAVNREQQVISELAEHSPFLDKGVFTNPAVTKIQEIQSSAHSRARRAYDTAKLNIGSLNIKDVRQFVPQMKQALVDESIDPSTHQQAYNYLDSFNRILRKEAPKGTIGVDFARLEGWRKQLNNAIRTETNAAEKYGLNQLKNNYDSLLYNNIERAMLNGNPKILKDYEKARSGWADFKKTYTAQHPHEYGKKFVEEIVDNARSREPYTNEMISNKIFGTSRLGFKPQATNIVNELKSRLGQDSDEFNHLRFEGLNRIIRPLLEHSGDKAGALRAYNQNLKESMPFLRELLPPKTIEELEYIGHQGNKLFPKGKKLNMETLENTKYIGNAVKLLSNKDNLVGNIYKGSKKSNSVFTEAISRALNQYAVQPEEQEQQQNLLQPIQEPEDLTSKYQEAIKRMSSEQRQRLIDLKRSMTPVE